MKERKLRKQKKNRVLLQKGRAYSPINARGFHNLKDGTLVTLIYQIDSDGEATGKPVQFFINDEEKAYEYQKDIRPSKLITYKKRYSNTESPYSAELLVEFVREHVNI